MEKKEVRIPRQKRSIEKKEKIIDAAYRVFMKSGYLNTNTCDIAKEAGISTGSVYAYFEDKKDILIVCLNRFGDKLTRKICESISRLTYTGDIASTIKSVLRIFVDYPDWTKLARDEILSLQFIDKDVRDYFKNIEQRMMSAVTSQIEDCGYTFRNKREQTFLLFKMILGINDELAFDHTPDINQDILIDECTKMILSMLVKN